MEGMITGRPVSSLPGQPFSAQFWFGFSGVEPTGLVELVFVHLLPGSDPGHATPVQIRAEQPSVVGSQPMTSQCSTQVPAQECATTAAFAASRSGVNDLSRLFWVAWGRDDVSRAKSVKNFNSAGVAPRRRR